MPTNRTQEVTLPFALCCFLPQTFGGIPWQVFWQRVLSAKSAETARFLCFGGGIGAIIMSVPPILIGAAAASTSQRCLFVKLVFKVFKTFVHKL